ncbi:hypothetical protein GO013_10940 [Pseudodesulfovibrio sp. JC047]|uniref:hypothetical protein n=1 Tax=Pseudodesulfovibrio sp. JC047 TaxID=2683199 RepID=UPI0013D68A91|nr:hypothetical protein [Pseudodesulfovibrio sp. JC047]NDV19937.1 hypothetical protein [Pseudodesulfovibrio sp. JC047]
MRTIFIALMLALTLAACGTKDETPESPVTPPDAAATQDQSPTQAADPTAVADPIPEGPVGTMQLADGSTLVITELVKLDKFYLYLSGKLNGRSSTIVSFTRFSDLRGFNAFVFKDQNNFIITTKRGKELVFTDAHVYIGNDSPDTYSFYIMDENLDKKLVTVPKKDVATIKIN